MYAKMYICVYVYIRIYTYDIYKVLTFIWKGTRTRIAKIRKS